MKRAAKIFFGAGAWPSIAIYWGLMLGLDLSMFWAALLAALYAVGYTMVISKEGESLIRKPIKELADELEPNKFWRIHRGTIVNAACISRVSRSLTGRSVIRLKGLPETLTVSRSYAHLFKQM